MPDPIPRPTRFRFSDEFFGALILDRFIFFSYALVATASVRFAADASAPTRLGAEPRSGDTYSTIFTKCGTFLTMPRIDGVSSRSMT